MSSLKPCAYCHKLTNALYCSYSCKDADDYRQAMIDATKEHRVTNSKR